ncbi:MAG: FkbM family methyltransferase [Pseudomonadota bacterium]
MTMLRTAQRLVNSVLGVADLKIIPKSDPWLQLADFPDVATVIDVGVCSGTPEIYQRFSTAELILVDPLPESEQLTAPTVAGRNYRFFNCALGASEGTVTLRREIDNKAKSSLLARSELTRSDGQFSEHEVPLRTLDALMSEIDVKQPLGLKIDTEGYELEVLKGASDTLARCEFVILECSVRRRFEGSYRAEELISYLGERGFTLAFVLSNHADRRGRIMFIDLGFIRRDA